MLGARPIDAILLVTDLDEANEFYGEKLQLDVVERNEKLIVFSSGQTQLKASLSEEGTKDSQTQASWRVDDVRAAVTWLRSRGVQPEEYDDDELKTDDGVADQGDAYVAWITDPFGNVLGVEQSKQ